MAGSANHFSNCLQTPNATTGLNTVIQSLQLSPGDCVFMLDIGYGSVKKMLEEVRPACQAI